MVVHSNLEHLTAILLDGLHLRPVVAGITNEPNILFRGFAIEILFKPVAAHIPIKDVNIHIRTDGSEFKGVLDGLTAADPAAVISFFVPAPHTLDHHQALAIVQPFILVDDQ